MAEKAGNWLRVSEAVQDEASQIPDLVRWNESHDYEVARTYTIHGKSAFKGNRKFDETWARVLSDMRYGEIDVLVVWKQDRIDRKLNTFQMLAQVLEAGGRVEFVTEPHLNDLTTMAGRISLKIAEEMAYQESKTKSDRARINAAGLRAKGSVTNRPSFGYRVECEGHPEPHTTFRCGHKKLFAPTAEGRKWVPYIYESIIAGKSALSIVQALDKAGILTLDGNRWNERYIGEFIKNPIYYGQPRNAGALETEAVVSPTLWQEANAKMRSRVKPGRGTVTHEKVLFTPICAECYGKPREGCESGRSPMYRSDKRGGPYFRCTGHGPQRKSCGAPSILVSEIEEEVTDRMCNDMETHYEHTFVAGDDIADQITRLNQLGAAAFSAGDIARVYECAASVKELEAIPEHKRIKPHWADVPTELTEARYFMDLTPDQRRDYLSRFEILAARGRPVIIKEREVAQ